MASLRSIVKYQFSFAGNIPFPKWGNNNHLSVMVTPRNSGIRLSIKLLIWSQNSCQWSMSHCHYFSLFCFSPGPESCYRFNHQIVGVGGSFLDNSECGYYSFWCNVVKSTSKSILIRRKFMVENYCVLWARKIFKGFTEPATNSRWKKTGNVAFRIMRFRFFFNLSAYGKNV